jgi:Mg2+-importing ATPase
LIAASVLSFFLGQIIEGAMILLFIVINTSLGFFQEYRSENTIKLLKNYISFKTRVIRGGKERLVSSENLVIGDIVILETGDKINADLRIIEAYDLLVDESVLTGESLLVSKQGEVMTEKPDNYFSASNICFSGTSVAKGKARGVVLATGKNTFLGSISKLTSQVKKVSDFEKGISKFSSFILKLVLITLVFVFIANSFLKGGNNFWELLIFSIALAISVIPEALPLVMTFSFSKGAMNLAKRKVIVKRLSSVEDLGNIDILCSDKTGTLTENKLTVLDFYDSMSSVKNILLYANLASSQSSDRSEPFDIALFNKLDEDDKELLEEFDFMFSTPFDPARQRNNVLVQKNKKLDFIVRGAAEKIFDLCLNIDNKKIDDLRAWIKDQGLLGRRVLAVAKKTIKELEVDVFKNNLIEEEKSLEFLGLIAFADPIKESVKKQNQKTEKKARIPEGVFPVGRLDKASHGLLILTNDGRITDKLLNPKYVHEKEYVVRTSNKLRNNFKDKMEAGVLLEGKRGEKSYRTQKCKVEIVNENTFRVILTEGKKHQIRRMCSALFQEVTELQRIRVMNIKLDRLPSNSSRALKGKELEVFLEQILSQN